MESASTRVCRLFYGDWQDLQRGVRSSDQRDGQKVGLDVVNDRLQLSEEARMQLKRVIGFACALCAATANMTAELSPCEWNSQISNGTWLIYIT